MIVIECRVPAAYVECCRDYALDVLNETNVAWSVVVHSHPSNKDKVFLQIGDTAVSVLAEDLVLAVMNCKRTGDGK